MSILQTIVSLTRRPVFTAGVVLIAALSISAATTFFAIFDAVLWQGPPFPSAERIVHIEAPPRFFVNMPPDEVSHIQRAIWQTPLLELRARVRAGQMFDEDSPAVREWRIRPVLVSQEFFPLFGTPAAGRPCDQADGDAVTRAVLISDSLWQIRFGGSPRAIGEVFRLSATESSQWRLVGVMPRGFTFPSNSNFWICSNQLGDGYPLVPTYARLSPDASLDSLRQSLPRVRFVPLAESLRPQSAWLLSFAFGCVLMLVTVAWVQIAGIIFSSVLHRQKEMGVCLALGASRLRIALIHWQELAILLLMSLMVAWLLVPYALAVVRDTIPDLVSSGSPAANSGRTVAFAALSAAVAFSLLAATPTALVYRASPTDLLRVGIGSRRAGTGRQRLLGVQLVLTTSIAYLFGLSAQSFAHLSTVPLGFQPRGLLVASFPPISTIPSLPARERLEQHRQRVRASVREIEMLPGVVAATHANSYPFQPGGFRLAQIYPAADKDLKLEGRIASIRPGYTAVLGLELVAGTEPALSPAEGWPGLALVSRSLATALARYGDPVGQIVHTTAAMRYRVVGVVGDVRSAGVDQPPEPTLYTYFPDVAVGSVLLARTSDAVSAGGAIAKALSNHWGSAPDVHAVQQSVDRSLAPQRTRLTVIAAFCAVALALAVAGIFGCVAHLTAIRQRDIATMLALGASPQRLLRSIVSESAILALMSASMGIGIAIAAARMIDSQWFNTNVFEPAVGAGVGIAMLIVSVIGAILPARRAVAQDPWSVLKSD